MIFLGSLGLLAFSALWSGYVLTVLWGWFIVPTFGGPALTIPTAIGVALIANYLTHQLNHQADSKFEPPEMLFRDAMVVLFKPAFALAFAWVVTKFM